MFLKIFLCSSIIVVASANNVIPAQTYPIYQQNGYMNPQTNIPSNIQPYLQSGTAQNALQQLNISPSTIKQALLNRLLTSPSMQTISDPNARNYSPNLNGIQNSYMLANPANNYAVVPRDYINNNTSYTNIDTNVNDRNTKKRKQSNKRRSKSRRQNDVEKIESTTLPTKVTKTKQGKSDIITKNNENVAESNKALRKSSRRRKTQQEIETQKDAGNTEIDNKNNRTGRRKKKQKEIADQTTQTPIKEDNKPKNIKSQTRRMKQKNNENSEVQNQQNTKSKSEEIENIDLDITKDGINNENRQTRNPKLEANNLQKSIPNTPNEITNHFLSNLNHLNNPFMSNWFANFEKIYQSVATQPPVAEKKPKRSRKSKRNRKSKRKITQNRNITKEVGAVTSNRFGINSTTTERIVINERIQTKPNSNPTEQTPKPIDVRDHNLKLSNNEIFQDGNAKYKEIMLKNLNNDKYYYTTDFVDTDFTKKLQKYNDELAERSLKEHERKHTYEDIEKESIQNAYMTKDFEDKIEENVQFRSPPHLESPDFRTREINKSVFRPEVYYHFDDSFNKFVEDKSSSYSSVKTPYNYGVKGNGIIQPKDVETVYAKSKVVAYGPVYTPEEDSFTSATDDSPRLDDIVAYGTVYTPQKDSFTAATDESSWLDETFTNDSFQSSETTYIIAKSLDYPQPQARILEGLK